MKLVKQLFKPIEKNDWLLVIQGKYHNLQSSITDSTRKSLIKNIDHWTQPGDKVQIYRLSFELKEAYVVGEKPVKKGKKGGK